jgi:hypothetical protein
MTRTLCGSLLVCCALPVFACEQPSLPMIPAKEDIGRHSGPLERDTQRYLESMTAYVACVQAEFDGAKETDSTDFRREQLLLRNNAAVAEFEAVTRLFEDRVGPLETLNLARIQNASEQSARARSEVSALEGLELDGAAPERCISTASLDATKVVNERAVLFYQSNGHIFLSVLDDACPEIVRSGRFVFQVHGAANPRLCKTDVIHAMDPFTGGYGAACHIGEFRQISEADAKALLDPAAQSDDAVRVNPVELPAEGGAE